MIAADLRHGNAIVHKVITIAPIIAVVTVMTDIVVVNDGGAVED